MSDIFREVEEDVRRERIEKLWKQYGDYVIAAVAIIAVCIAGYTLWQRYEHQQVLKASAAFAAAEQISNGGDNAQAAAAFAKIAREAPSGYAIVAKLSEADALLASGDTAHALALYKLIAQKDDKGLGDLARIRAAWALADTAKRSELETLLAPVDGPNSAWRFVTGEIFAYCDYRDGRLKQSQSEYENLAAQTDAPSSLRARANAMATLIATGAGRNYGTVPKPIAPVEPAPGAQQGTPPQ